MIPWLETNNEFPNTDLALLEPNGLLAAGGELSTERLLDAYQQGIFPWYNEDDPILWWSPSPRCILLPEELHISKSMNRLLGKRRYYCTANQAFGEVMYNCAHLRQEEGTWILPEMVDAYTLLHKQGYAKSVEVWRENILVGGIYGIQLGEMFFGESMFSLESNTSKIAFITLASSLKYAGFTALDCQVGSPHLYTLGAKDISRDAFKHHLKACQKVSSASPWDLINQINDPKDIASFKLTTSTSGT